MLDWQLFWKNIMFLLNLILGLCLLSEIWHCYCRAAENYSGPTATTQSVSWTTIILNGSFLLTMTTDLSQLHYVTVQADLPDMHIYYLLIISYTQCVPPNVHLIFFNTRSKISRFELFLAHRILEKFLRVICTCPPRLKNVITVPQEMQISCTWSKLRCFSQKSRCIWNSQSFDHTNFRQAILQELFRMSNLCWYMSYFVIFITSQLHYQIFDRIIHKNIGGGFWHIV